jgi:hypothetical protein
MWSKTITYKELQKKIIWCTNCWLRKNRCHWIMFSPGLPEFSWCNIPKRGGDIRNYHNIYLPNGIKYTKWQLYRPNGHKIYQLHTFIARHSKIYSNLDFWFENIQPLFSGCHGLAVDLMQRTFPLITPSFWLDGFLSRREFQPHSSRLSCQHKPGLPDFSWSKHTKSGKIYQMTVI